MFVFGVCVSLQSLFGDLSIFFFSGWAAVVANLEDIVSAFKTKFESFEQSFNDYLKGRDEKFEILEK